MNKIGCEKSSNGKDEDNVLSAKEAAFLTDKAIINNEKKEFNNIMKAIKKQAEKGYNSIILDCISPSNKKQLIDLGYKIKENITIIGWVYEVSW